MDHLNFTAHARWLVEEERLLALLNLVHQLVATLDSTTPLGGAARDELTSFTACLLGKAISVTAVTASFCPSFAASLTPGSACGQSAGYILHLLFWRLARVNHVDRLGLSGLEEREASWRCLSLSKCFSLLCVSGMLLSEQVSHGFCVNVT